MAEQEKRSEASASSQDAKPAADKASAGNRLLSGSEAESPRVKAEREIAMSISSAGSFVRSYLGSADAESMAAALDRKAKGLLAMSVLDAANNIAERAASSGKGTAQLAAAGIQPGALAMQLAQRMAAKRNSVPRRIVEVVHEVRAEVVQPTAAEADSGSDVAADSGKVDAADGDGSTVS